VEQTLVEYHLPVAIDCRLYTFLSEAAIPVLKELDHLLNIWPDRAFKARFREERSLDNFYNVRGYFSSLDVNRVLLDIAQICQLELFATCDLQSDHLINPLRTTCSNEASTVVKSCVIGNLSVVCCDDVSFLWVNRPG